jgi:MFS family permease
VTEGTVQASEQETIAQPSRLSDWWALFLIVLCYGFYNLDKSLIAVLIEPIKAEFRLNDTQMGLLTGLATSIPFALFCIPVGMLADRTNRRNLLAVLVGGWSFVTGLTSLVTSTVGLFASRVGIGGFEAGFTPTSLSQLSDRFPLTRRATVMGIFNFGAPGGLFMGMAMGGFVEDNYGWRTAFLIAGVPGVILAVLLWLTTREPARGSAGEVVRASPSPESLGSVFLHMLRDKAIRNIAMGMTWGASMLAVFAVWTPSLLRRSFGLSATEAGLGSGLSVGLLGAVGAVAGGIVADRIGKDDLSRKLLVPIAAVLLSLVVGLIALLGGFGAAASPVLLGVAAFCCQGYIGTGYAITATLAGPSRRAVTLSVLLVLFGLVSYSLGSGVVGKLSDMLALKYENESLRYAYAAAFIFCVFSAICFFRAWQDLRSRPERDVSLFGRAEPLPS